MVRRLRYPPPWLILNNRTTRFQGSSTFCNCYAMSWERKKKGRGNWGGEAGDDAWECERLWLQIYKEIDLMEDEPKKERRRKPRWKRCARNEVSNRQAESSATMFNSKELSCRLSLLMRNKAALYFLSWFFSARDKIFWWFLMSASWLWCSSI